LQGFVAAQGLQGFTGLAAAQGFWAAAAWSRGTTQSLAPAMPWAALGPQGLAAAQGLALWAESCDELPAASTTPMPIMSGRNVVDRSRFLRTSMADRLLRGCAKNRRQCDRF
jgi:hypothetical protein